MNPINRDYGKSRPTWSGELIPPTPACLDDDTLEALCAGRLDADQVFALRQACTGDAHAQDLLALYTPISDVDLRRITAQAQRRADVRTRWRRLCRGLFGAVPAIGAAAWLLMAVPGAVGGDETVSGMPTTYSLEHRGGLANHRGSVDPAAPLRLDDQSEFTLDLRPTSAVIEEMVVEAFIEQDGQLAALPLGRQAKASKTGSLRLVGSARDLSLVASTARLVVVLAPRSATVDFVEAAKRRSEARQSQVFEIPVEYVGVTNISSPSSHAPWRAPSSEWQRGS